jgi:hypothetical protein
MKHVLVKRGRFSVVKFTADSTTADIEAFAVKESLQEGSTDDALSFRASETDWRKFMPMVSLDSNIRNQEERLVAFLPHGNDPFRIDSFPRIGMKSYPKGGGNPSRSWPAGIWFIFKEKGFA